MIPLAGMLDIAFLGHLPELRHLAGVALATVLFNYIYWTFGFLRMATTGTTAQAVGRQDQEAVLLIGLRNVGLALTTGVIIWILQYPLREIGFALLSATSEVKAAGIDYYNALIWGAPATLINFVLIGWFLGQGQGAKVLLLSAIGNGANVVLDYLFVVQQDWGSAGAGWGTGLSQYLMLLAGLVLVGRTLNLSQIRAVTTKLFDAADWRMAFALNGDIVIRTFALVSAFALFTNLSSALGTTVLATNTLLLQVVTLTAYFIDGLAFATESFAGIFYGQGASDRLLTLLWLSGGVSLGLGLVFASGFALFPMPLFSLLTNHTEVLVQINRFVLWLFPVLGFGAIAYTLDGYFLGLTKGQILRQSTVLATLVGFVPMGAIAWQTQSPHLLWMALVLLMAVRAITLMRRVPETLPLS
ncbi:MAG: MATE family efflux transporter [Leptolyngbyaceae cyanobacterium RM2_2_4]|nr:MATE family efflux transporter [Leptolyngbyaceae cyanobacterium SM1_4_3]NJN92161.1 MATE family efflux transporter [Leptolyngbyaceae cyanobacterium SL_5_14]NJO52325.1 MATE family efflux transporter [Leptolyngbyaceae cyanobacterium RM2_2_4]NJO66995.1 MATE family efflux transporter [Leptolyngbyaceae cyanobacterium RM1_405_57]